MNHINGKQFAFLALVILILNLTTIHFGFKINWMGNQTEDPLTGGVACMLVLLSLVVDIMIIWYYGEKFYNWLGKR